MNCTIGSGGVLQACNPESEEPAGYGFGAAAAGLAGKLRVKPWTAEGLPTVGGLVRVPLRYDLQQEPEGK
jgi:hypothetical protein